MKFFYCLSFIYTLLISPLYGAFSSHEDPNPNSIPPLHPRMGSPYVLDPTQKYLPLTDVYGVEFKYSKEFNDALDKYKEAQQKGQSSQIILKLEKQVIRFSLADRQRFLAQYPQNAFKVDALDWADRHPVNSEYSASWAPAELSGALSSCHRNGTLGSGVQILIWECVANTQNPYIQKEVLRGSAPDSERRKQIELIRDISRRKETLAEYEAETQHAANVTSIILQVAPRAQTKLVNTKYGFYFNELTQPHIINWSGGSIQECNKEASMDFFEALFKSPYKHLLVKSVPNASRKGLFREQREVEVALEEDAVFSKVLFPIHSSSIILVGNLDPSRPDNIPISPLDPQQQSRFICAVGTNVLTFVKHPYCTGTSFSAPTVTAGAALVMSAFPTISPQEAGDILLASARRFFWGTQEIIYKDSRRALKDSTQRLVYDKDSWPWTMVKNINTDDSLAYPPIIGLTAKEFNKEFGRGFLDLRRAMLLAKTKVTRPDLPWEEVKTLFEEVDQLQQTRAARKIQKLFKSVKGRMAEKRRPLKGNNS